MRVFDKPITSKGGKEYVRPLLHTKKMVSGYCSWGTGNLHRRTSSIRTRHLDTACKCLPFRDGGDDRGRNRASHRRRLRIFSLSRAWEHPPNSPIQHQHKLLEHRSSGSYASSRWGSCWCNKSWGILIRDRRRGSTKV